MVTAKLVLYTNSKYRKSAQAVFENEAQALDVISAVNTLQKYFDISVEVNYETEKLNKSR